MKHMPLRVAVDIGGTFTDVVVLDLRRNVKTVAKAPSTPDDYSLGVMNALKQVGAKVSDIDLLIHGTTAHLNALLQRNGAATALVTTKGFGDVYKIARGNRIRMYDLHYRNPEPLVARFHIREVAERLDAQGRVIVPLEEDAAESLSLESLDVEAIAVCLLHSYVNPDHEDRLARAIRARLPSVEVYPSFEICREWREYERTSSTVINAYTSPILSSYLASLRTRLAGEGFHRPVFLMQSNGGLIESSEAERRGALTLMSGPVGGAVGCLALSRELAAPNLICVDMGGTSFDFGLVTQGKLATTSERTIAGFPLLCPSVDVQTIGAGGGSVAWVESGSLRVGPRSAGAVPGPACYGKGGNEATVTDANVVLGRIPAATELGGTVFLSGRLAAEAIARIGDRLGLSSARMAEGIVEVVNARMANAIRSITIGRGIDPREFALVSYGGAGPLHAAALAEELGIESVIVPDAPGVFSARGMLQADVRHEQALSVLTPLDAEGLAPLEDRFRQLESDVKRLLLEEGIDRSRMGSQRSLDMRYAGQEYFINVALPGRSDRLTASAIKDLFDDAYDQQYGHKNLAEEVEIVNVRVEGIGRLDEATEQERRFGTGAGPGGSLDSTELRRDVVFDGKRRRARVINRRAIAPAESIQGPAVINEPTCTTLVPPGWTASVHGAGHLLMRHHG
jgi:N-methylhydantoinase A